MKISGREKILWKRERRTRVTRRSHYGNFSRFDANHKQLPERDVEESSIKKSHDYRVTKIISKIISFMGWLTLLVGFVIVGYGLVHSKGYENIDVVLVIVLPGIGMIFTGLFLIVAGQIARATVDNANHNKNILILLRREEEMER